MKSLRPLKLLYFIQIFQNWIVQIHYSKSSVWRQQHNSDSYSNRNTWNNSIVWDVSRNKSARWITYFCHVFTFRTTLILIFSVIFTIKLRKEEKLYFRFWKGELDLEWFAKPEICNGFRFKYFINIFTDLILMGIWKVWKFILMFNFIT